MTGRSLVPVIHLASHRRTKRCRRVTTVKIFMPAGREKPVYAPYVEHTPPDVTACIFWLKNRDPQHWRDSQQLEYVLGRYVISDRPLNEEEWAKERAVVVDMSQRSVMKRITILRCSVF
jgi:hypothetical protein